MYEYPLCITTFLTTFNYHCKLFKTLFKDLENDLFPLIGNHRIIVSERRNPNLKDLLFVKKKFTEEDIDRSAISHPCHRNCKTCPMVYLNGVIVIDGIRLTLYPDEGSCTMEDIVYIAYCMVEGCNDFYIGQETVVLAIGVVLNPVVIRKVPWRTTFLTITLKFFLRASITLLLAF